MDSFTRWWNVLVQIFEYFVLAAQEFKNTDQGRQEWQDILDAFETASQMDLNEDGTIGRSGAAPQARSAKVQPRAPEAAPAATRQPVDDLSTTNRSVFDS